ncbi:hypothetical protein LC087_05970 [Bacillus carboniphilus]|uniref:Uncharacterized protein n=1 Tax=Bacillus carboniphilus TaxID=86663 RepID=A0ABY9JWA6_9BACI|nr:hypothetical protein [Bacillus carboniphilus]WLR43686.1 hypothetical protein LC087_05970 [Bacillus carboniphilus]
MGRTKNANANAKRNNNVKGKDDNSFVSYAEVEASKLSNSKKK